MGRRVVTKGMPPQEQLSFADLPEMMDDWRPAMKRKGLLPISRPQIGDEEILAVKEVLQSGLLDRGPKIAEFEQAFAKTAGSNFAVATGSCTQGLLIALQTLGVEPGDEVILPSLTWVGTATAVLDAGATPVFVDINRDSFNIDPDAIEGAVTERTKAIIPVHFAGSVADLSGVFDVANRHKLSVVQDAAQALGSEYKGKPIAWWNPGKNKATVFSFCPTKNMTAGGGGMIALDDRRLAADLHARAWQGVGTNVQKYLQGDPRNQEALLPGHKHNLTSIQAAIGLAQLGRLNEMLARRRELATYYRESFSGLEENGLLRMQALDLGYDYKHSFCYFPVLVENAPDFMRDVEREGVETGYITALHLHPWYGQTYGLTRGMLPNAEHVSDRLVLIPLYPSMTNDDAGMVVRTVHDVLGEGHPTLGGTNFSGLTEEREMAGVSGDDIALLESIEHSTPIERQQLLESVDNALMTHLSKLLGMQALAIGMEYLDPKGAFLQLGKDENPVRMMVSSFIADRLSEQEKRAALTPDGIKQKMREFVKQKSEEGVSPAVTLDDVRAASPPHLSIDGIERRFDLTEEHDVNLLNEILKTIGSKKRLLCTTHPNAPFVFAYGDAKERRTTLTDERHGWEREAKTFTFPDPDISSPFTSVFMGETVNDRLVGIFRKGFARAIDGRVAAMFTQGTKDPVMGAHLGRYGVNDIRQYYDKHPQILDDIEERVRAHEIGHLSHSLVCGIPEPELYDFSMSLNTFSAAGKTEQDFLIPSLMETLANLAPQGLYPRALDIARKDPPRAYRILSEQDMLLQGYETGESIFRHHEIERPLLDPILEGGPENLVDNLERLLAGRKLFDGLNAVFMDIHQFAQVQHPDEELLDYLRSRRTDVEAAVRGG